MAVKKKKEPKHWQIQYDLQMSCPMCQTMNQVKYVMGDNESFECTKCKQKNNIMMSFVAIVDNPPGVRTMMVQPPERRLNKNVGGVILGNSRTSNG